MTQQLTNVVQYVLLAPGRVRRLSGFPCLTTNPKKPSSLFLSICLYYYRCGDQVPPHTGKKTVLVTGAAGFIGSWVADTLLARGDDVVIVDEVRTSLSLINYETGFTGLVHSDHALKSFQKYATYRCRYVRMPLQIDWIDWGDFCSSTYVGTHISPRYLAGLLPTRQTARQRQGCVRLVDCVNVPLTRDGLLVFSNIKKSAGRK